MKPSKKQEVIDLFILHRKDLKQKYKVLVQVLLKLTNSSPSQKRYYNASRYAPNTLETLEYDIKKLCGITDRDLSAALKVSKTPLPKTGEQRLLEFNPDAPAEELRQQAIDLVEFSKLNELLPDKLPEFSKGLPGNTERKQWLKEQNVDHSFTRKDDLQQLIEKEHADATNFSYGLAIDNLKEAQTELIKSLEVNTSKDLDNLNVSIFKEAPQDVKEGIKLRDEFPFLASEDCPDEFKILTADKLTAYHNYVAGRKELKALVNAGASNEDIFEIAKKTVENFELNLEIYDELNYYKEHGKILGEHPIFADKMLAEKVENMSTVDLTKRQKNLRTYVSRDEKAFKKMEEGESKEKFGEKLQSWKDELALVDARLEKIS